MVRWADPGSVEEAVRSHARALHSRGTGISRILWYGSWVSGIPTPSSDVDLCVVLHSDPRRPRDRVPDYLPDRFPVAIDLVVLTESELRALAARSPSWYRAILAGREV